jgi:hypothetical protein
MITNTISRNAALVIRLLTVSRGETPVGELLERSGLAGSDFYLALGWLTREGRLLFYDRESQLKVELAL